MKQFINNLLQIFESVPDLYLIINPDLVIVGVSDAYLRATKVTREHILGQHIFEAFPDNPNDPHATGVTNLKTSLKRVLETKLPDTMAVQKYDIRLPEAEGGGFAERYWSPLNTPVLDENKQIKYIIHRVEDITEFIHLKILGDEQQKLTEELRTRTGKMEIELYNRAQQLQEANKKLRIVNEKLSKQKENQKKLNKKLAHLNTIKTQFFANVSHELRTPLTLILHAIEKLVINLEQEKDILVVKVIERNANILLTHVNDLLDIARLDVDKMHLSYSKVDLVMILKQIVSLFDSRSEDQKIRFKVIAPETLIAEVDPDKIQRIIINLLSNAFKFTPQQGTVTCTLSTTATQMMLRVVDTGPGIPEHLQEAIFERFFQIEESVTRQHGGSGLGLSIIKDFVALHKGTIQVSNTPKGGAQFLVTLPLQAPEGVAVSNETKEHHILTKSIDAHFISKASLTNTQDILEHKNAPLVLVIEDNIELNHSIVEVLTNQFNVRSAYDGQEGLEQALQWLPDLIITDIMMPKMSGAELVVEIKKYPQLNEVPIVILSAKEDDALRIQLLREGAKDYLTKPFSRAELLARVNNLISLKQAKDVAEKRNKALSQINQELDAFSYSISHDLRAPLRVITGFSQTLLNDFSAGLEPEAIHLLQRICSNVKKMDQLIEALLNFSHLSRCSLSKTKIGMTALVKNIYQYIMENQPQEPYIQFTVQELPDCYADYELLYQILFNLISNAIKYSAKQSTPSIEIGFLKEQDEVVYFIKDNGVGFNMQYAEKLFTPFQRLHSAQTFEGTGVGLAIVRRLVERHGGRIWAEAELNKGATFYWALARQ